ncbi:MAG TPA: FecR domain-containing protein [Methylomirabilota bacterium]
MGIGHRTIQAVLASTIATLALVSLATAQERAGVVTTLEGKVTVVRATAAEPSPLKFRDAVFVRDRIATDKDSFARVLLGGRAVVTIREYSTVTITEVPGVATIDVAAGRVAVAVARERMRPGDLVEVRTPNAVAGIRGTVIVAEVFDARHSVITVLKGVIDVTRLDAGRLVGPSTILNALQQVTIGGAVSLPQPVSSDTARGLRDEFRTAPPRGAPVATTTAVGQGEMERVSKDLGIDKGKGVQTVATTGDDTTSGGAASASSAPATTTSGSGSTQATSGSGTGSSASSGSASATASSASSGSASATANAGPVANTPAASNAAPVAAAPATPSTTPVAAAPATPTAAPAATAPATTAPATPSAAPAVAPVASPPAVPSVAAASLKDPGDLVNFAVGVLKDVKADKADRPDKIKKR